MVHEADDSDGIFNLTVDDFAPTASEIAVVEAEVNDEAWTKAIETIKKTVRSSGRQRVICRKLE
jgi:hypothetical protein